MAVTLTNSSSHNIRVWSHNDSDDDRGYRVNVRDDTGAFAPDTKRGIARNGRGDISSLTAEELTRYGTVVSGACGVLKSGTSLSYFVTATRLYGLSKPGKYTVQLECLDEESKTYVKSNTVTVTITAKR